MLLRILPELPVDFHVPVVVVQHGDTETVDFLVDALEKRCRLKVTQAGPHEMIKTGCIYFAPAGYHVLIESEGSFTLTKEPAVSHARPSIDVLFESAADAFGENVLGMILTGANDDGAAGLQAIRRRGGVGIVQKPDMAAFPYMPAAALSRAGADAVLSPQDMVSYLRRWGER